MTDFVILSDLDGVLVDSTSSVGRIWRRWAREHDIPFGAIEPIMHGVPSRQTVAQVAPHLDPAAESMRLDCAQADDTDGVAALPGAAVLLSGGYATRYAIVTSCDRHLARARLDAARLPMPPVTITSDMVSQGKPHPDAYLLGAERMGADPANCVVVEDAPAGIAAGRSAGMRVVAVTTTHGPEDLTAAHAIVADLRDLPAALERL